MSHQPPQRPKILLVEDTEDDAFLFQRALRQSGVAHDVTHVTEGGLAIQHLTDAARTASLPDLVFLDLKMPMLNGFEVLTWIRDQKFNPPMDVAVLSGSENAGDMEHARSLGADDYYVKPMRAPQLTLRLDAWNARHLRVKIDATSSAGTQNGAA